MVVSIFRRQRQNGAKRTIKTVDDFSAPMMISVPRIRSNQNWGKSDEERGKEETENSTFLMRNRSFVTHVWYYWRTRKAVQKYVYIM